MGLLDFLFSDDKKKKGQQDYGVLSYMNEEQNNNSEYTDEELNDYGLENWEKEQVKKGENDPWNFDEEDLEDDDFIMKMNRTLDVVVFFYIINKII